jgi:hypothetical protein
MGRMLGMSHEQCATCSQTHDITWRIDLGYIDDQLLSELEKDINGVGAPLAGLVRSTKADTTLLSLAVIAIVAAIAWLAA